MTLEQRQAVVAEAKSWVRTPYHHEGRVKGAGVDCLWLLYAVYTNCGVIKPFKVPHYSHQWHLHRGDELYENGILQHAYRVSDEETPMSGDVVLYREGRTMSHGAIVTEWPMVIHADSTCRMVIEADGTQGRLADRERRTYRMKSVG